MKMKKTAALLMAILMAFSVAVTGFAEVMNVKKFYDKEENILYYFGNFGGDDTDAGVEIGGVEYSVNTEAEPRKFEIAKHMGGNFGVGLKNPEKLGKVEIKPYAKDKDGNKVYYGKTLEYDPEAVSDDAVLVSAEAELGIMVPAFSSFVTDYTVGVPSEVTTVPGIAYTVAEGFEAQVTEEATAMNETTKITVTDENGKERVYSFKFETIQTIDGEVSIAGTDGYLVRAFKTTEKIKYSANMSALTSNNERITFWKARNESGAYVGESDGSYDMSIMKFAIPEATVVDNYGEYILNVAYASNAVAGQEYTISAFEIKNNDLTRATITEETIAESETEVGNIVSSVVVKADDLLAGGAGTVFSLDISDYVRSELIAGRRDINVGVAITGLKTSNSSSGEFIRIYHAGSPNSNAKKTRIVGKSLSAKADLASAGISEEAKEEGSMFLPAFDKDITTYYIGVPAGKALPEINYEVEDGITVSEISKASNVGEETKLLVTSKGGLATKEYRFVYEAKTTTGASTLRAVASQNYKNNGVSWQYVSGGNVVTTYDRVAYYGSATNNNNLNTITRFAIPENASKYDEFVVAFKTNATLYGNNKKESTLTFSFNEVKWNDTWTRISDSTTTLTGFEIGETVGTATVAPATGTMTIAPDFYCDVTDYVREEMAKGKNYINLSTKITNATDYEAAVYVHVYRFDYSKESYGPTLMVNPANGLSSASVPADKGFMYPAFSNDVYNYDIVLPQENAELPEITYTLKNTLSSAEVTKAVNVGDATIINVTTYGRTVSYKFTYKNPYTVSDKSTLTVPFVQGTTIRTANKNGVWTSNATDYIRADRKNVADESAQVPSYALIRFDLTDADVHPFGKYVLTLTRRGTPTGSADVIVKAANTNQTWENLVATYNNTFLADMNPFDETATAKFSTKDANVSVDISNIVRNQLAKNQKVFTIALDVDYASMTGVADAGTLQPMYYIAHATASRNPQITYYPVAE